MRSQPRAQYPPRAAGRALRDAVGEAPAAAAVRGGRVELREMRRRPRRCSRRRRRSIRWGRCAASRGSRRGRRRRLGVVAARRLRVQSKRARDRRALGERPPWAVLPQRRPTVPPGRARRRCAAVARARSGDQRTEALGLWGGAPASPRGGAREPARVRSSSRPPVLQPPAAWRTAVFCAARPGRDAIPARARAGAPLYDARRPAAGAPARAWPRRDAAALGARAPARGRRGRAALWRAFVAAAAWRAAAARNVRASGRDRDRASLRRRAHRDARQGLGDAARCSAARPGSPRTSRPTSTAYRPDYRAPIVRAGGFVANRRVNGRARSRALGDVVYKAGRARARRRGRRRGPPGGRGADGGADDPRLLLARPRQPAECRRRAGCGERGAARERAARCATATSSPRRVRRSSTR